MNTFPTAGALRLTHFHVKVKDLSSTLSWFARVCDVQPVFQKQDLAYLSFGEVVLVLETGATDTETTLAFASVDCDRDFAALAAEGVPVLSPPESHPWGVRSAYLRGPAGITFELEQRI